MPSPEPGAARRTEPLSGLRGVRSGTRGVALPSFYVTLDVVASLLTLLVAGSFAALWRRSREALHLLVAFGFLLIGASFLAITPSHQDLGPLPSAVDATRIGGQLGGALVLLFAYASARWHERARPWLVLGWVAASIGVLLSILYWVVPPVAGLLEPEAYFPAAHLVMTLAFGGCLLLSSEGFRRRPSPDRALVPAAYLAWAASKYTWLLLDLSGASRLVYFVYFWRFSAILLLLLALRLPRSQPPEVGLGHAPP